MNQSNVDVSINKQREIITLNCGGYGVNIGQSILEQFAVEHGISSSGTKECKTQYDSTIPILFNETKNGNYKSRSLFTDLNAYSINNIKRRYAYKSLLNSESLISGYQDACCNYAIGRYTQGIHVIDSINDAIRKQIENTDNCQGFIFNHSLSGGTGSGLTSLILENISNNYHKKIKFGMSLLFNEHRASSSLEIYNSMLSMHQILNYMDVDLIFDNKACDYLCKTFLQIQTPKYKNYNNLLTKLIGDITASIRFGINESLSSFYMDMIGFPRIKFLTSSMWPLIPKYKQNKIFLNDIKTLTVECMNNKHFIIDMPSFDIEEDKVNSVSFCCRSNDSKQFISQMNSTMNFMLSDKKLTFMEFSGKPMMKFVDCKANQLPSDDMFVNDKQISMVMNNSCMSRVSCERITKKYDILYANQKCYIDHYISQGMEESEFFEARENLGFFEKDNLDLFTGMLTESEEDSDDYSD